MSDRKQHETTPLDVRLAALPRELPPARDLWPGIDAAIEAGRPRRRHWPVALAAGLAVAALGAVLGARFARELPLDAGGRDLRSDSALVAAGVRVAARADYLATRAELERTYRERLALLAPATRARIEQDLALIRSAREDIERALEREPGSRVLTQLLESTTEQEFSLYATVGRNTEPLAARTRT